MNITIKSKTDNEIEVEVKDEGHTLLNVLKDALLRIDDVEATAYDMNPESSGQKTSPVLYVKTDGKDPLDAIQEGAEIVNEEADEFIDAFQAEA